MLMQTCAQRLRQLIRRNPGAKQEPNELIQRSWPMPRAIDAFDGGRREAAALWVALRVREARPHANFPRRGAFSRLNIREDLDADLRQSLPRLDTFGSLTLARPCIRLV